ncbi:MAG: hypothetical protein ABIZ04_21450 [Opitutus sp.]
MNKKEITEALETLRKQGRRLKKKADTIAGALSDAQQFQIQIEEIGEPHYKDQEAMVKLATLERQLSACNKAIDNANAELGELVSDDLIGFTTQAGTMVGKILQVARDRRVETVTAVMRPFFAEAYNAQRCAIQSDACATATHQIQKWHMLANDSRLYQAAETPYRLLEVISEIEAVFTEALKDAPNIQQFIPFEPPTDSTASVSELE